MEFGVPFSDPVADGPVIQAATEAALRKGADPPACFHVMKRVHAPKMILTYYNIIYKMGEDAFAERARDAGVSAILAADLPVDEAAGLEEACAKRGIETVFIVAPNTGEKRIREIAGHTTGFLYLMAHFGVTGAKTSVGKITLEAVRRVRKVTDVPVCVGFGISKEEHTRALREAGAHGAIVGSAFVKLLQQGKGVGELERLAKQLKRGCLSS